MPKKNLNKIEFSANDVDGAYLIGVFNAVGLDGLAKEIERIKKLGIKPHEMLRLFKNQKI